MGEPTMGELLKAKYSDCMTLRDWFAGQALAGILSNPQLGTAPSESWAESAYDLADAMLTARNNNTDDK